MRKIIALIMAIVITAGFTGCSAGKTVNVETNEGSVTASESEAQQSVETVENETSSVSGDEVDYPLTVTDSLGNEMVIEKEPERIISLALGSDEIIFELVQKSRIKALSYLSKDSGLSNISGRVGDIETIGTNSELVIAAQPDIVFVTTWSDADFIKQIREAGITVYAFSSPTSVETVKDVIKEIAYVLNAVGEGRELIAWMDGKLEAVRAKLKKLAPGSEKEAISLDSFYYTYGKLTTFDSLAQHAGVINLAAKKGMEMWVLVSKEQVVDMNPDIIFLPSWSYEGFDAEKFANEFKNDDSLAGVSAIMNNKVFSLPESHTTSLSQYMVLGVEDIARAAYPELFD